MRFARRSARTPIYAGMNTRGGCVGGEITIYKYICSGISMVQYSTVPYSYISSGPLGQLGPPCAAGRSDRPDHFGQCGIVVYKAHGPLRDTCREYRLEWGITYQHLRPLLTAQDARYCSKRERAPWLIEGSVIMYSTSITRKCRLLK